jgi:CHAT domain-containing protein
LLIEAWKSAEEHHKNIVRLENRISGVLEWLWESIAEPVLNSLGYSEQPSGNSTWPTVWWCPTGIVSYLPIHAAGYHDLSTVPSNRTVMDRVVSAYTSTIKALKYSRNRNSQPTYPTTFIGAMPTTAHYRKLPKARDEAYRVKYITKKYSTVQVVENITVQELGNQLPQTGIVHLVCHAVAEPEPSTSRLLLEDGSLSMAEISRMKIQEGALAYLSACSTASGCAEAIKDECISLSTGFQVAGFARVVGTLWKADDQTAFNVAVLFYEDLDGDILRARRALHAAVRCVRDDCRDSPSLWAPYIYTGA